MLIINFIRKEVQIVSNLGNKTILSKNLQYYMEVNKKERNEICRQLNIPYTTFTDWLNGTTYPRIDNIEILAEYFGIQKSDLIEDKPKNFDDDIEIKALSLDERALILDYRKILVEDRETVLKMAHLAVKNRR